MRADEFENYKLKEKRNRFYSAVVEACEEHHFPMPHVNFEGCELETSDSLAHIHCPEGDVICCSERQMNQMDYDKIRAVAFHEVAHIAHMDHSPDFQRVHHYLMSSLWQPPSGVVIIKGKTEDKPAEENSKEPETQEKCNSEYCNKTDGLEICDYCGLKYCEDHFSYGKVAGHNCSKAPSIFNPSDAPVPNPKPKKYHSDEVGVIFCERYGCKTMGKFYCQYCEKKFCQLHYTASRPAMMGDPGFGREDGHPCMRFPR